MKTIKMTLTPAQMRKHTAGEPFQLTHKQLTGGSTGKHTIQNFQVIFSLFPRSFKSCFVLTIT